MGVKISGIKKVDAVVGAHPPDYIPFIFRTKPGLLGRVFDGQSAMAKIITQAPAGSPITYTISAGKLPNGLSMSEGGVISGIPDDVEYPEVSSFTVTVSNGIRVISREFSIEVRPTPVPHWITVGGVVANIIEGRTASIMVEAEYAASFEIIAGSLPVGFTLNTTSGEITGIAPYVSTDTTHDFTVRAYNSTKHADRNFSIKVYDLKSFSLSRVTITPPSTGLFDDGSEPEPEGTGEWLEYTGEHDREVTLEPPLDGSFVYPLPYIESDLFDNPSDAVITITPDSEAQEYT